VGHKHNLPLSKNMGCYTHRAGLSRAAAAATGDDPMVGFEGDLEQIVGWLRCRRKAQTTPLCSCKPPVHAHLSGDLSLKTFGLVMTDNGYDCTGLELPLAGTGG
jgi:hypothetical protein